MEHLKTVEELGVSPAPWKIDDDLGSYPPCGHKISCKMWMIARCYNRNGDARLIAAAPELYNALQTLVKIQEEGAKEDMLIPAAWQYAKIVLLKASGEKCGCDMSSNSGGNKMKTVEELGVSPAPWRHRFCGSRTQCVEARRKCEHSHDWWTLLESNRWMALREAEANIRLIAAAPELYQAVVDLLGICGDIEEYIGIDPATGGKIEAARKAVEKAGGAE